MIAALVLAAGAGTRFGDAPKLLAELDGRPLVEHAIAAPCAVAEIERVLVVLGSRAEQIRSAVRFGRAEVVVCPDWADGQAASLRCGAGVLAAAGAERVIVTLGDVPRIAPELIRRFLDAPPRARAVYGGVPGHPVVLGSAELAAAQALVGDQGARGLLAGGERIECADLAPGTDVDTLTDLVSVRASRTG